MKALLSLIIICFLQEMPVLVAQDKDPDEKALLEVYYFHGTKRCPTCLAIEDETRKTLDEFYKDDLKTGKISLHVLNLEDKENEGLVEKFEIGWSSLILYRPVDGVTINLTEDGFAYARTKPEKFQHILREEIDKLKD